MLAVLARLRRKVRDGFGRVPGVETPGYCRSSLWDFGIQKVDPPSSDSDATR